MFDFIPEQVYIFGASQFVNFRKVNNTSCFACIGTVNDNISYVADIGMYGSNLQNFDFFINVAGFSPEILAKLQFNGDYNSYLYFALG